MAFLYPLLAVLIWAVNAIVNKLSAGAIDPAAISFYRWLLALLVLTPFVLPRIISHWHDVKPHLFKFLILGLLGMALYQSLAYYAAYTISALTIGIFVSIIPLLTVLLSIFILKSPPTIRILIGSILSFIGIVWLISGGHPMILVQSGVGKGELMMLIAAIAYALYGVLTKHWSIPVSNWQSLYMQIIFGVLLLFPEFLFTHNISLNTHNIWLVIYAGIPASIIAPFVWIQGVIKLGASKTALFMNLTPIFTAIISIFFLHESLHSYHLIGGILTLIGVAIAQRLQLPSRKNKKIIA
ncbi:DMT family transporter [Neisseria sp. Ec49-e6-T10]|uniref:DMT family transporter n=1 Tax=Neisseria sp. Ec49-e6-T10 TaxID=3140744 RepID=UPI003EBC2500